MNLYETPEKTTILIVDDQPNYIQVLANLLKEDYHILVAKNGPKALEIALGVDSPDLILLDIEMPEMSGHEVCRRLKDNDKTNTIPVIFVTARDATKDEEVGFNLGAVDYISKPFHPAIVRARVRNHMDLKVKTDMLEELSMQDGLTNIPNRRYFDEQLSKEWKHALRNNQPLSLVMLDIDNFKLYNDNYGHGAGDECLKRVARALKDTLSRPTDMVARYGGEEFAALLPETDAEGALNVAEQLRAVVQGLAINHEYSSTASVVTLSVGVETHSRDRAKADMQQLQQSADQALYRAKEQGRNQVQSG